MSQIEPAALNDAGAATLLGVSPDCFRQLQKQTGFVTPIYFGPKTRRWLRGSLSAWLDDKEREARESEEGEIA